MKKSNNNNRRAFSSVQLIIAVSLFVASFSNISFFTSAQKTFGLVGENALFVGSLFVYITAIFIIILALVCHRFLVKPLLIGFLLLSSVIAYYSNTYGTIFDYKMISNLFESSVSEASDLFNFKLLLYIGLLGGLPSLVIYYANHDHPHWKLETIARVKLLAIAGITVAAVSFTFSGHYTSMMREHRDLVGKVNPSYALAQSLKLAKRSLLSYSYPHLVVGAKAKIPVGDNDRELVIMVVGETARADHFSLNGYGRKTNPRLKREKVVNFPDFWSCGTSTAYSVPCIFSHYTRTEFTRAKAKVADNALDILKRSGVSVLWRDNNSSSKGVADNVTYEDYQTAELNTHCNEVECRDEGMLVGLQEYINAHKDGDILIVLHQMGNHGPAYYKRYPKRFEKFTPVCNTNDLGACTSEEITNAYDNAILYTDYFLSKVIELLKKNDDDFETAMVYASDHGESLGEMGVYLHATPYLLAPDAQKHVPAVMWFGKNFETEDLGDIENMRKKRLSHDNIFSTLLGLFEIRTSAYDPKMDILDHVHSEHW